MNRDDRTGLGSDQTHTEPPLGTVCEAMPGDTAAIPIRMFCGRMRLPEIRMPPGPGSAYGGPVISYQWRWDFAIAEAEWAGPEPRVGGRGMAADAARQQATALPARGANFPASP